MNGSYLIMYLFCTKYCSLVDFFYVIDTMLRKCQKHKDSAIEPNKKKYTLKKLLDFRNQFDLNEMFLFFFFILFLLASEKKIVPPEQGLEPWTFRLKAWRSTNWATRALLTEWMKFQDSNILSKLGMILSTFNMSLLRYIHSRYHLRIF